MKVVVRPVDVEEVIDLNEINGQLQSFIENLQEDFLRDYRIGSDVAVFEKFPVVVDNEQVLLSDIAQITKEFPRLVVIDMVAYPELIKDVVNSLQASDLNVNPVADGSLIKVQVSQATTEYRKQVVSKADKRAKTCKSEMRQYIAKEIKAFRNLEVSDNMKKIVTEQLAIYLDYHLPQVDNIFKAKEAALLAPWHHKSVSLDESRLYYLYRWRYAIMGKAIMMDLMQRWSGVGTEFPHLFTLVTLLEDFEFSFQFLRVVPGEA